jgi:hypothetical protein
LRSKKLATEGTEKKSKIATKRHKKHKEKLTTNKHEWTQFFTAENAEVAEER